MHSHNKTIFDTVSVDRKKIKWEEHLYDLTPFENHHGIWFKREDTFAPLGYGGPNGSKMRQLIWYMNKNRKDKTHVVTGASIQSPQLSMSAIVGAHYGLLSKQFVYTKPETLLRHPNPRVAAGFGAEFFATPAGFNPNIQREVRKASQGDSLVVHYGITTDHINEPEMTIGFHDIGANQVKNLPNEVETLIMPAGSCNSLTSVLLGLSRDSKNLKRLYTVGIGPDKTNWVRQRLEVLGVDLNKMDFKFQHHSLHDTGYSKYTDHFKGEVFDGIEFHTTYEAKIWRYLRTYNQIIPNGKTAFWIVGGIPSVSVISPHFTHDPNKFVFNRYERGEEC